MSYIITQAIVLVVGYVTISCLMKLDSPWLALLMGIWTLALLEINRIKHQKGSGRMKKEDVLCIRMIIAAVIVAVLIVIFLVIYPIDLSPDMPTPFPAKYQECPDLEGGDYWTIYIDNLTTADDEMFIIWEGYEGEVMEANTYIPHENNTYRITYYGSDGEPEFYLMLEAKK